MKGQATLVWIMMAVIGAVILLNLMPIVVTSVNASTLNGTGLAVAVLIPAILILIFIVGQLYFVTPQREPQ